MDAALEAQVLARLQNYQIRKLQLRTHRPSNYRRFILRIGEAIQRSVANRLQVLKKELSN
jgi:hypothetical protein